MATFVVSLDNSKMKKTCIESNRQFPQRTDPTSDNTNTNGIPPKYFALFYKLSWECLTKYASCFQPLYWSTWWMSFTQLSTVVLCLFLQTARPLVTKRCFQTVCCLTAIQVLFWVVRPREDVSLMEHGVVSQLCVPVGLKYTLLLKRIISCLEAKVCPLYR